MTDTAFSHRCPVPADTLWAYGVDDFGIVYTSATMWPFADEFREKENRENWLRICERQNFPRPAAGTGQRSVRLAPDVEYGGSNAYAIIYPSLTDPALANAFVTVFVHPQGTGWIVYPHVRVAIDLVARTATVDPELDLPDESRAQAEGLADRLAVFIGKALDERAAGVPAPVTAYQKWRATCSTT